MRIPFRERNPVPIGLAGFAAIVLALALALNLQSIPFVAGGTEYKVAFAEAAGLEPDEDVRIAGVKVGQITGLELKNGQVEATMRVDDGVRLGDLTRAEIKIATVLGAHYVELVPRGSGKLGKRIPVERTAVPYEVVPAISDLSKQVSQIDHKQVAKSFDVLTETFRNSPEEIRASLRGLRRLSSTIASRDKELHQLAGRAADVSGLLAKRNQDFAALVRDGDKILQAVRARRQVIHQLLVNTVLLSQQVNALISENEKQIGPMLDNLEKVNKILLKNQQNLDRILELFAPFTRQFADVTGTGRWFDSYIQNLIPLPASIKDPPSQNGGGTGTTQGQQGGGAQDQQGGQGGQNGGNPLPFLP